MLIDLKPDLTHCQVGLLPRKTIKSSAFCLSLISQVLRTMVRGSFRESAEKQILLDDVDERALGHVMDLACGQVCDLREMMGVGAFAHRYQMAEVVGAVEVAIVRSLTVDNCGEVLRWAGGASGGGGGCCPGRCLQLASWGWIGSQSCRGVRALRTSTKTCYAVWWGIIRRPTRMFCLRERWSGSRGGARGEAAEGESVRADGGIAAR